MKITELFENYDEVHQEYLDSTGFWGAKAAGCLIMARSTGRILIAHRSENVQEPHTWGTWGGAVDPNENPQEAVRREVREETGFNGQILKIIPLYVFKNNDFSYYNFLVVVDDEFTPHLNWENQGFKWCEFGDWPYPLHFGLKALLSHEQTFKVKN